MKLQRYDNFKVNEISAKDTGVLKDYLDVIIDKIKDEFAERGFSGEAPTNFLSHVRTVIMESSIHRNRLMPLAKTIINDLYGDIIDAMNIKIDMDLSNPDGILDVSRSLPKLPRNESVDWGSASTGDKNNLSDNIDKRKIINMITQGAAKNTHRIIHLYESEFKSISSQLFNSIDILLKNNEYFEFYNYISNSTSNMADMMQNYASGFNKVTYKKNESKDDYDYVITARGIDFGVLLHEVVKGIMEVFAVNAFPENTALTRKVLSHTDSLSDEVEDLVLGTYIYRTIITFINNNEKINSIKNGYMYVLARMYELEAYRFKYLIRDILSGDFKMANRWLEVEANDIYGTFKQYERDLMEYELSLTKKAQDDKEDAMYNRNKEANRTDDNSESNELIYDISKLKSLSKSELQAQLKLAIDAEEYELASIIEDMV